MLTASRLGLARKQSAKFCPNMDLVRSSPSDLRQEISEATTELKPKKLGKRLKVIEAFIASQATGRNG